MKKNKFLYIFLIFIFAFKGVFADNIPDFYMFMPKFLQPLNTFVASEEVIITGISTWSLVTISWWEYKIGTWLYTSNTWTIFNNETIQVRHLTSTWYLQQVDTILNIWWVSATFSTTTDVFIEDIIPDIFSFSGKTKQWLNTLVESDIVTITGINTGVTLSIQWWEYKIGTWSYTSNTWIIYSWDTLQLQHITSSFHLWIQNTIVTIWWWFWMFTSDTFVEEKDIVGLFSSGSFLLTWSINVWSWFLFLWENVPNEIYSFTWWWIVDLFSGWILWTWSSQKIADILLFTGTNLYTSSWNIKFEKKLLWWEKTSSWNIDRIFTWVIKIWTNESILLDTPAEIKYYSNIDVQEVWYRRSWTTTWNIIEIESSQCLVNIETKPICAYKENNTVYIYTYHFTDFSIIKKELKIIQENTYNWWWWWWWSIYRPPITQNTIEKNTNNSPINEWCIHDCIQKVEKKENPYTQLQVSYEEFRWYKLHIIKWYPLSDRITRVNRFIITSKYIVNKKKYITTFNNFLVIRFHYDKTENKSVKIKNNFIKYSILVQSQIKSLEKEYLNNRKNEIKSKIIKR